MIRLILVGIFLILFLVLGIPLLIFEFLLSRKHRETSIRQSNKIVRLAFKGVLLLAGTKVEVRGLQNLPKDEAVLFVGNHRSYFDIVISHAVLDRPVGFVAKKEIKKVPLLNFWMEKIGCLFLDRDNVREGLKTILEAIEQIKQGLSMYIYPEGTRNESKDPLELMEFHEGSLKIAQKAGCAVIPVALYGTDEILEKHFPLIKKQKVTVVFGDPVYQADIPAEYKKRQGAYIRELIIDMLSGLVQEKES